MQGVYSAVDFHRPYMIKFLFFFYSLFKVKLQCNQLVYVAISNGMAPMAVLLHINDVGNQLKCMSKKDKAGSGTVHAVTSGVDEADFFCETLLLQRFMATLNMYISPSRTLLTCSRHAVGFALPDKNSSCSRHLYNTTIESGSIPIMDGKAPKLLVVAGNRLAPQLAEYALKVAVRLDLGIIVLFVDEERAGTSDGRGRDAVERFEAEVEKEAAGFSARALKMAVKVTTIVDVDSRASAIALVREQEPEIRFILSDDEQDNKGAAGRQYPRLTVIRPA